MDGAEPAYEALLLDVVTGELAPEARVDARTLARRHGESPAAVREALGRLALDGLVERRPHGGAVVAALDLQAVEHAFEVRSLLEGRAAALAARRASAREAAAIAAAFGGAEAAVAAGDARALLAMDRAFHRAVALATGNGGLARYLLQVQAQAARYWAHAMARQPAADQLADVALHRDLARAIAAGDARGAEAAAARLIGDPPSLSPGARLRDAAGRATV